MTYYFKCLLLDINFFIHRLKIKLSCLLGFHTTYITYTKYRKYKNKIFTYESRHPQRECSFCGKEINKGLSDEYLCGLLYEEKYMREA